MSVEVATTYPFEEAITHTITATKAFDYFIRIPGWADKATVGGKNVKNGIMHKVSLKAGKTVLMLKFPMDVRVEAANDGAYGTYFIAACCMCW